jgi:hypothetical protein
MPAVNDVLEVGAVLQEQAPLLPLHNDAQEVLKWGKVLRGDSHRGAEMVF